MYRRCQNYPLKKPVAELEEDECLFKDFYALAKRKNFQISRQICHLIQA